MRWFRRWYGANPLHLLTLIGCFALAWYAGAGLLHGKHVVGVVVWFAGAVIGHDLILMPLYALADRSVLAVFGHRRDRLPTVPWINYLRVPVVLSGMLLLIWFPLIFKVPGRFPRTTDLSLDPYLGHWLLVTGALFLLSAVAFAVRLRPGRRPPPAARWPDPPVRRPVAYGNPPGVPHRPGTGPDWPQDWPDRGGRQDGRPSQPSPGQPPREPPPARPPREPPPARPPWGSPPGQPPWGGAPEPRWGGAPGRPPAAGPGRHRQEPVNGWPPDRP